MDDTRDTYLSTSEPQRGFAPGGSIGGSIEDTSDVDVFDITLQAGRTYTFTIAGSMLPNRGLRLYDDDGTWIAGSSSTNQFTYTVTENGPFHLYAYGSGATGAYTVSADAGFVDDTRDTQQDFTLEAQRGFAPGGSIGGSIEIAGDVDVFDINLVVGRTYTFTISGSMLPNRGLRLYDDNGTWIAGNTSTNQFTYTVTNTDAAGPFHLYAYGGGATGTYTVSETSSFVDDTRDTYLDTVEPQRGFAPGGSIGGSIEITSDVDALDITLVAGRVYTFTISGSTMPNRGLRLYDDDGTWIAGNTSTNQFTYTATENGPFYLYAYGGGATGTYTVSASAGTAAPLPVVRIDAVSASKNEGSTGGTTDFTFKVTRSGDTSGASSVDWALNFGVGSPADASDFTGTSGRVSFAAGEIEQLITVRVNADTLVEGNENFLVELRNPTGATINATFNAAAGTIQNDDGLAAPVLAIAAASADKLEGSTGGLTDFTFTVTRTGDTSGASSVNWQVGATQTGSVDGTDFSNAHPLNGIVQFAAGQTQQTITVRINADTLVEGDETFVVRLSNPTNASIRTGGDVATGIVRNDDGAPARPDLDVTTLSLSSGTITSGGSVTFNYHLENVGTALAGASKVGFYASTDGVFDAADTLLFEQDVAGLAAGAAIDGSQTRSITGNGTYTIFAVADSGKVVTEISEANNPSNGQSLTINPATAPVVGIAISSANKNEGSTGGLTSFTFTVTRSGDTSAASTVDWQVAGSGAAPADSADFSGLTGRVSFAAGETSKVIAVKVNADTLVEANETFSVSLRNAVNATIDAAKTAAIGTIRNDDVAPRPDLDVTTLSLSRSTLTTGGTTTLSYHLENVGTAAAAASTVGFYRSADSVFDASDVLLFQQSVGPLAAGAAIDGTFNARLSTVGSYRIIAVADSGKVITEISETNNPSNAAAVTVAPLPVLAIAAASADKNEGSTGGTTGFTFTVTRTGSTTDASTVDWQLYQTTGATIDAQDYDAPTSGRVSFAAGQTTKTITIKVKADTSVEQNEGLAVKLETATGATIDASKQTAFGIIRNDDTPNTAAHDLNGDGRSDILWRNDNGAALLWQMNGETVTAETTLGTEPVSKRLVDAADFTGDGRADLLWHVADGSVFIWEMNGAQAGTKTTLAGPGAGWAVQDAADFGGDGKSDILWRHGDGRLELWQMNGAQAASKTALGASSPADAVADAADFNGDGRADILWQNGSGSAAIWLMNGASIVSKTTVAGPGAGWKIQDAADFGGDGKSDILWRHDDGRVELWQMNGTTVASRASLGDVDTALTIVDAADFNGDKRADILWRNTAGDVTMWEMNGAQILDASDVRTMAAAWKVVNHDFG